MLEAGKLTIPELEEFLEYWGDDLPDPHQQPKQFMHKFNLWVEKKKREQVCHKKS